MKAYIQSLNGIPVDDWGYAAYLGFQKRGTPVIFYEDIYEVPTSRSNIVVGCIEDTKIYFDKLGVNIPDPLDIPKELNIRDICGRWFLQGTMKNLRSNEVAFPYFMKSSKLKGFVPGVVTNNFSLGAFYRDLPDDEEVVVSEVVNFVSEYRVFISEGRILGIKHYLGDVFTFPKVDKIFDMVKIYSSAPIAYTLDIGVVQFDGSSETFLVECNDAWSIGNYGLEGIPYTEMLLKRWLQILNQKQ